MKTTKKIFKLSAHHLEKDWGWEKWLLSCFPKRESSIADISSQNADANFDKKIGSDNVASGKHTLANFLQDAKVIDNAQEFPILVKVLFAQDPLSVQVHPSDANAIDFSSVSATNTHKTNAKLRGKTECWLILKADKDAEVLWGLKANLNKKELEKTIYKKEIVGAMHAIKVSAGDLIHVPAGTLHAIGGGITLLEVQQSCDTTFRVYDYQRNRELHIRESLRVVTPEKQLLPLHWPNFFGKFSTPYFSLQVLKTSGQQKNTHRIAHRQKNKATANPTSSFSMVFCIEGKIRITVESGEIIDLTSGEGGIVVATQTWFTVESSQHEQVPIQEKAIAEAKAEAKRHGNKDSEKFDEWKNTTEVPLPREGTDEKPFYGINRADGYEIEENKNLFLNGDNSYAIICPSEVF